VATNGQECAKIGADILARNGSAVDAAIAALLCEGVASLHRYIIRFVFSIYEYQTRRKNASGRSIRFRP